MSGSGDNSLTIGAMPEVLLDKPLEFFAADHQRQRVVFSLIERLATADTLDRPVATEVLRFLENDMVAHVLDEENDLFPLLEQRCKPEDNIELVLGDLAAEHSSEERTTRDIREGLAQALEANCAVGDIAELKDRMLAFAHAEQRHLALENGIVLPLARTCLTQVDLANLSRRMTSRRTIR